jgi:crotonobetainyl-CoA:carnitine CoA-transferase CaiB-like acyl-CoA transferase
MTGLPLQGIRVVDLAHAWAAPHCSRLLADFGAEVIKVEYVRRLCILRGAVREEGKYDRQPGWAQVNRNKLSMTLDLEVAEDRDTLRELVRISDVLVENSRTGVLQEWGLAYKDLAGLRPDLVMLSMPAFGGTGPWSSYAGYGAIFEAMSGIQSLTAYARGTKPVRIKEIDTITGLVGACAVMTALFHRRKTGQGQHIDLSQLEAASHALAGEHLLEYAMSGRQTLPLGNRHFRFAPQGCYPCRGKDAWITLSVRTDEEWRRFCAALGHPEWIADRRFSAPESRRENHDALDRLIETWTSTRDRLEAMRVLQEAGIAAGAVLDLPGVASDPGLRERGYFAKPAAGGPPFMGTAIRISGQDPAVRRAGPRLGEHDEYVRCQLLGQTRAKIPVVRPEDIGLAYDPE